MVPAGDNPPYDKADVCNPDDPCNLLVEFKSFTSVQLVPLYASVKTESPGTSPPKANAAV